jgi:hypothetical protein
MAAAETGVPAWSFDALGLILRSIVYLFTTLLPRSSIDNKHSLTADRAVLIWRKGDFLRKSELFVAITPC